MCPLDYSLLFFSPGSRVVFPIPCGHTTHGLQREAASALADRIVAPRPLQLSLRPSAAASVRRQFVLCRADFSGRACCDAGQVVQLCCCSEKLRNACGVIVGQTASWISNARSRTPCLTTPDRSQVALSALRRCKDSTLAINSSFALTFTAWRGVLQKMVLFVLSTVFHAVFCCLVARTREATCDALHATLVSRLWRGRAATRRGFLDRVSSHALNVCTRNS